MECGACALNCPVQAIEVQTGVGCAWAMISTAIRGKGMDSGECSCGGEVGSCCGGSPEKPSCSGEREICINGLIGKEEVICCLNSCLTSPKLKNRNKSNELGLL